MAKTLTPGVTKLPAGKSKFVQPAPPVSKGGGYGQIWKGSKPTGGKT